MAYCNGDELPSAKVYTRYRRAPRSSTHLRRMTVFLVLLLSTLHSPVQFAEAEGNFDLDFDLDWADLRQRWFGVSRFLLAHFCLMVGIAWSIYPSFLLQGYYREFLQRGIPVKGDVLSCTPSEHSITEGWWKQLLSGGTPNASSYTAELLYNFHTPRYSDPRMQFRHPDAVVLKRFLIRVYDLDCMVPRGAQSMDMLVLPGFPKSGLPKCTIEFRALHAVSKCRVVSFLLPGILLLLATTCMTIRQIQLDFGQEEERIKAYVVCGLVWCFSVWAPYTWCQASFEKKKIEITSRAVSMVPTAGNWGSPTSSPGTRDYNEEQGAVRVQGSPVVVVRGVNVPPEQGGDTRRASLLENADRPAIV